MYGSQKGFVIVGRDGMLLGTSFSYNLGQVEYRRREVRVPGGPCRRLTVYPGLVWRARVWVGTGRRRTRAPTGGTGHVWFSNNLLGKRSKRFLCGARPIRAPTVHLSYISHTPRPHSVKTAAWNRHKKRHLLRAVDGFTAVLATKMASTVWCWVSLGLKREHKHALVPKISYQLRGSAVLVHSKLAYWPLELGCLLYTSPSPRD